MKDNRFFKWVKNHKLEIAAVGATTVCVGGIIGLYRGWDTITNLFGNGEYLMKFPLSTQKTNVTDTNVCGDEEIRIIFVNEYVRNLPCGQHPSKTKILQANQNGILLLDHQTFVSAHQRRIGA